MYLRPPCYGYAYYCHLVCWTRPLCMKKQNLFVLFIYNRKKMKFKFVQIKMKQVSYLILSLILGNTPDKMLYLIYMYISPKIV